MSNAVSLDARRRNASTLSDLLPGSAIRDVALVVGLAAFIGLTAQIVIPLPFTPVPVTGQTFGVLLGSAAVGFKRAVSATTLYLLAGLAGIPWFAGHAGGTAMATSPLFGYIIGFVVAAALSGALAGKHFDRKPKAALLTMVAGNTVIYLIGATWLALSLHIGAIKAVELGILPFLPGDALKIALASALLPASWYFFGSNTSSQT